MELPKDGDRVLYFFSPFETWWIGTVYLDQVDYFDNGELWEELVVVGDAGGFTTWTPEVTKWYPLNYDNLCTVVNSGEKISTHIISTFDMACGLKTKYTHRWEYQ